MAVMKWISLLCLLSMAYVMAEDKELTEGDYSVKILGQSGKMTLTKSGGDSITVSFDELKEVDAGGNAVGTSGTPKHSFNTFANQAFTFSDLKDTTLDGVKAKAISYSGTLSGLSSTMNVTAYLFTEDGEISNDDEKIKVEEGQSKFSIELSSWQWCNPCSQGGQDLYGAAVELTIEIKGKGTPLKISSDSELDKYSLGGDSRVLMSGKVQVDGTWKTMPEPKLITQGSKQLFKFSFEKFDDNIFYDPTLDVSGGAGHVISLTTILFTFLFSLYFSN